MLELWYCNFDIQFSGQTLFFFVSFGQYNNSLAHGSGFSDHF